MISDLNVKRTNLSICLNDVEYILLLLALYVQIPKLFL